MYRTEREINEAIQALEQIDFMGERVNVEAIIIDILEEIRALKFGVGEVRKNEKQVKESAKKS